MTDHSTFFEPARGGLALTQAILLYQSVKSGGHNSYARPGRGAEAFASIHAVEHGEGGPVIAAGSPLTRAHLREWIEALGRTAPPELLPGNVLVAHADMIAWWVPEQIRPAYFNLSSPPEGLKALSGRVVAAVPYPAHLFVATRRGLGVYALPENHRPDAQTRILHSPVLNVFLDGQLCWGNIAKPRSLTIAAIAAYEAAVFDSWSTHPNQGQEATIIGRGTGKGGLVRIWDDLAARKARRFPVKRLRPFGQPARRGGTREPVTLGSLVGSQR
jgi:PRTRC genetic system protein B